MKLIHGVRNFEVNGEKKSYWTVIGRAKENKDGSINLYFDYLPFDSKTTIQIREKKEKQNENEENVEF